MNDRSVQHEVTVRQAPQGGDDKDKGIAAIIKACLANPVAAFEIVCFIGGGYAVYYALEGRVDKVEAASTDHYNDLKRDLAATREALGTKLEASAADNKAQNEQIAALFKRGDDRYTAIIGKLSSHDVDIGKISTGVDYLVAAQRGDGEAHGTSRTFQR